MDSRGFSRVPLVLYIQWSKLVGIYINLIQAGILKLKSFRNKGFEPLDQAQSPELVFC